MLQCVVVNCSVFQCVVMCCRVLQCVALCRNVCLAAVPTRNLKPKFEKARFRESMLDPPELALDHSLSCFRVLVV